MKKFALPLAMTALTALTACGSPIITINSETEINHYPLRTQEVFPRGKLFFSCTTVAALFEYLDHGVVSRGCMWRQMTAPTQRSDYDVGYQTFHIYEFQENFWSFYTYEGGDQ